MKLTFVCLLVVGASLSSGCGTVVSRVGTPPVLIYQAQPLYPFEMRQAHLEGSVEVEFIVDPSGATREVRVTNSSRSEFEPEAIAAVARWRFKPAMANGRPIDFKVKVPITFSLGPERVDQSLGQAWPQKYPDDAAIYISGILTRDVFPGPPRYRAIGDGDSPDRIWLLTSSTVPPDAGSQTERYQLVIRANLEEMLAKMRQFEGKRVYVSGRISVAHTVHERTRYLITVAALHEAPDAESSVSQQPTQDSG